MFSEKRLDDSEIPWGTPNITFNLLVFVIIKFILQALAISSPICAGVFYPSFVLGAGFGRLYGHILRLIIGDTINETTYSVIGAACVVASVTRTVSVAMIVFELNGNLDYLIPVLFSVVISYAISNNLAMSIFDVLLDMKDLPYLPALKSTDLYDQTAGKIMNKNFLYLTADSRLKDIVVLLQFLGPISKSVPIVESEENKILLYSVQAQSLRKYLFFHYYQMSHKFDAQTREKMNQYFSSLYAISQVTLRRFRSKAKPGSEEELVLGFMQNDDSKVRNQFSMDSSNEISEDNKSMFNRRKSLITVNEYNKRELYDKDDKGSTSYSATAEFWSTVIDYSHEFLEIDRSPFTVMSETPLTKVHFLFTMLSISQLFVTRRGVIVGILSKNEFLRSNKQEVVKKEESVTNLPEDHDTLNSEYIQSILTQSMQAVIKEEDDEDDHTYEGKSRKSSNDR